MHISTRGRYGTRAMLSLATRHGDGLTSASQIAQEQEVSVKYLERILTTLKTAGLVVSEKGVRGGYALSRHPREITLHDILDSMGENLDIVFCTVDESRCHRRDLCVTRDVWIQLRDAVFKVLEGTTLADLQRKLELKALGNAK